MRGEGEVGGYWGGVGGVVVVGRRDNCSWGGGGVRRMRILIGCGAQTTSASLGV